MSWLGKYRFSFFRSASVFLRLLFVSLFVYAAVSKLLDFETFQVQLAQSPLLSAYAGILAWAVPVAELVIAGLLCFESTKKLGVSGFFFMMIMFSAYIFFILKFADFVPCSCGDVLEKMSWGQHLVFNLIFVALSGIILYFGMHGKRRRRWVVLGTQFILGIGVVESVDKEIKGLGRVKYKKKAIGFMLKTTCFYGTFTKNQAMLFLADYYKQLLIIG